MLTRLLFSKKFWAYTVATVLLAVLIISVIAHFVLNAIFDDKQIYQTIHKTLGEQGYIFNSEETIRKSWFPAPNITLHNVSIADEKHIILSAQRINIRFTNTLLFGNKKIEKITVNYPQLNIRKNQQGQWNIQHLLQSHQPMMGSNRFLLTNGTVHIFHDQEKHIIDNIQMTGEDLIHNGIIQCVGEWQSKNNPIPFQFQTKIQNDRHHLLWQDFSGSLKVKLPFWQETHIQWQLPYLRRNYLDGLIETGSILIEGQSEKGLSFNIRDSGWQFNGSDDTIISPKTTAIFHWTENNTEWKANIVLEKSLFDRYNFQSVARYNLTRKTPEFIHTVDANALLMMDKNWQHIDLSNLKIQTLQSNIDNTHVLWQTDMSGNADYSLTSGVGKIYLSGTLDKQPLKMIAQYHPQEEYAWQGKIVLDTLNLTPHIGTSTDKIPALNDIDQFLVELSKTLKYLGNKKVRADLSIGRLKLGGGQINHFSANILANQKEIHWQDMYANIYGGTLKGSLKLNNSVPPVYSIDQDLANINVGDLLFDTVGYPYFSGIGNVYMRLNIKGGNKPETIEGDTVFVIESGELRGFNFEDLINNSANFSEHIVHNTLGFNQQVITPFTYMTMLIHWKNGMGITPTAIFESDSFTIDGEGSWDIQSKNLDFNLALMGKLSEKSLPIYLPLHIMGQIDNPQYTVDYNAVVRDAQNSEERQQAIQNLLHQQWILFRQSGKN